MQPPKYVGRCRNIRADDARRASRPVSRRSIRFRVPEATARSRSTTSFAAGVGFRPTSSAISCSCAPTAFPPTTSPSSIDDALMEITHVIRGEDHISNTPRQLLLYEAFGWKPPRVRPRVDGAGPDHAQLSKRHGATSVGEFRERGYLPEALANYLALLGWSPGENEELLPLDELAKRFRIEDVGKSAGVFDPEKLAWVNRHYLKLAAPDGSLDWRCRISERLGWVTRADAGRAWGFSMRVVPVAAASVDRLDQVPARLHFCSIIRRRGAGQSGDSRRGLEARERDRGARPRNSQGQERSSTRTRFAPWPRVSARRQGEGKALFHPIRLALTGEPKGSSSTSRCLRLSRAPRLTARRREFARDLKRREPRGAPFCTSLRSRRVDA